MAQPVWTLSVDLQAKTATFQSGMAAAAQSARSSFQEIKSGADEMGRTTSGSMGEARHGVMLLGEEFGVHLPRGLTTFIASLGPVGAAMEAAFPFLAIIVGATLLLKHLAKLKEEGESLTRSQVQFGTAVSNVLNKLDEKLLEAGIRTDELNHDHLAALHKQLELIDRQSMSELVQAFDTVAKAADLTMAQLKTSWYQFGAGSSGAKNALDEFKTKYDSLLAQGKNKEATDLLAGTRQSAEHILELQNKITEALNKKGTDGDFGDMAQAQALENQLKQAGAGYTTKEIEAQQTLVDALRAQVQVQEKVNALKDAQKGNAVHVEQDRTDADSDKAAREQAQQQKIAMEEADKLWEQNYREAVAKLQENEREKIDATKQGSAARLAAVDAAIKEEESKGLQETNFYRGLLTARVEITRQMLEEQNKLQAEAGKEEAEHETKMGELKVQADRDAEQLRLSAFRASVQERVASAVQLANEEYDVQREGLEKQIAALDKSGNEYANKLKALQGKELELVREHENKVAEIKDQAEEASNARILSAEERRNDAMAKGLSDVIMRHERMGKMLISLGDQMAAGMIQNALKMILADDMTKEHDAAAAARKAYVAGMNFPFPANLVMGPALGAMAFASVMAFETGGLVPGVAKGDSVHAMLTPGEAVLNTKQTDALMRAGRNGGSSSSGGDIHIHHSPTYHVQTIDGDGIRDVLQKHNTEFTAHFHNEVRKMNH